MKYRFFIQLSNGTVIEWTGLSLIQAKEMSRRTKANAFNSAINSINSFGWEEQS